MNEYSIERHLRFRTIRSPRFGLDDQSLYAICDITGNDEIWEISSPKQWPRQRTFTGQDVTFGTWSPNKDEMVFGLANTGDEEARFYLLDDKTDMVTPLIDEPGVIHRWGGWNSNGSRFAYAANRQRPGAFDVYTQGRDETHEQAKLVYEQVRSSPMNPLGWGPENDCLLVLEAHSNYNSDIHLVDLNTGTARLLTLGPTVDARYRSIHWGPDGESLYMITDQEYNWRYIARLGLTNGNFEPVVQMDCNIKNLVFDSNRERLAYTVDENGYTDIVIGRLKSPTEIETFPIPSLPPGKADSLTMSSDGKRVATVYSTPVTKPDLYTIDVETGKHTQWTDTSQSVPNDNFVAPASVSYESFDGLEIPSFYAEPETTDDELLPAIIFLHAGPRQRNFPAFNPPRQYYLEQGFVRFEPNYRGSSGYGKAYMALDDLEKRPDAIKDVKAAADWLATKDIVDEDRIVLKGPSYGGFLTLAAITRWPDRFAAGVAIAPITNFETYLKNTAPWRRKNREAEYGSLENDAELLRELSPIKDVARIQSPLLVVHGKDDSVVPIKEAKQLVDVARHHDIPIETLFIDGAGHRFSSRRHKIQLYERVAEFLERYT